MEYFRLPRREILRGILGSFGWFWSGNDDAADLSSEWVLLEDGSPDSGGSVTEYTYDPDGICMSIETCIDSPENIGAVTFYVYS